MSVHLYLTPKILDALRFDRAIDGKGHAAGATTEGIREWMARDTGVRGLLLRLTPRTSTWYVQRKVAGMPMRRAMGHWWSADEGYRRLTLTQARKRAKIWLGLMEQGLDPLVEKKKRQRAARADRQRDGLTMAAAFDEYLKGKSRKAKPSTTQDRGKIPKWMKKAPLWSVPLHDLTEDSVEATFAPMLRAVREGTKRPPWGPKSLGAGTLSKIYSYCASAYTRSAHKVGLPTGRGVGPFARWRADQPWPVPTPRTTYLPTQTDTGQAWLRRLVELQQSAHDPDILKHRPDPRGTDLKPHLSVLADFFLCVLLWGSRKDETAKLQWEHIDFERRFVLFPAGITKTGKTGLAPLTPWSLQILKARRAANARWRPDDTSTWVFPSRQHGKPLANPRSILVALQEQTGLWITAHDLRRTLATDLSKARVQVEELGRLLVVGAALNHASGATGAVPSAVTMDYIQEKADLLRPHHQARENRLRRLAGMTVLVSAKGKADPTLAALLREIGADKGLERKVFEALKRKRGRIPR